MSTIMHSWNNQLHEHTPTEEVLTILTHVFNSFPFLQHNHIKVQISEKTNPNGCLIPVIECVTDMNDHLLGNPLQRILHGGVTASMLDTIGGIQTMYEIAEQSRKGNKYDFDTIKKRLSKVATIDFRTDYLAIGKGEHFIATAEVLKFGSRHCTCQMKLVNEKGLLIAIATGNYVY